MSRRVLEPIQMAMAHGEPSRFRRGHRSYVVRRILASWREARPWWVHRDGSARLDATGEASRKVWRLEVGGPGASGGVVEVGEDGERWVLLRVLD